MKAARRLPAWVWLAGVVALALTWAPLLAVAVLSVNASRRGTVWNGFSLRWYAALAERSDLALAALNSLILATASTAIATVIGSALAIGLGRPWGRTGRGVLMTTLYLPVVAPDLVLALALVLAFAAVRAVLPTFTPGLLAMTIGHVTFQIAFVALVVQARLAGIGRDQMEAARDCFASDAYAIRRVLLPQLWPGIAGGAVLAFTLSLDDFIIGFLTASPHSQTLPLVIYAALRQGVPAEIHALSTLVLLVTTVLVFTLIGLGRQRQE